MDRYRRPRRRASASTPQLDGRMLPGFNEGLDLERASPRDPGSSETAHSPAIALILATEKKV